MNSEKPVCWVCGSDELDLIKRSDASGTLSSRNFAITNFDYGKTGELRKCRQCGFIQCTDLDRVVQYYEDLEDAEYENTRKERKIQEEKLVKVIARFKKSGSLLDIGAGSGIMIEAAMERGYECTGIEPSKWLQQKAAERNLPVVQGLFPHPQVQQTFDIISLVDVIEHVTKPADLLVSVRKQLADDGIFVLVTPDVSSIAARVLGYKWWHYRFAHIGYFNRKTLEHILSRAGFRIIRFIRPSWYFSLQYLGIRFLSFLPQFMRFRVPGFLQKISVPVNLRDSLLAVCEKNDTR